MLGFRNLTV